MSYDDLGNIMETQPETDKKADCFWVMDESGQLHQVKDFDPENSEDWLCFFGLMLKFSRN